MPPFQITVSRYDVAEPIRDWCQNTFYIESDVLPITDFENILDDVNDIWDLRLPRVQEENRVRSTIRAVAAPPGDPVLAMREKVRTKAAPEPSGPREVALCLSYYAGANTRRKRGRMYIGPWNYGALSRRPLVASQNALRDLALDLGNLGGVNVDWVQYSPTNNSSTPVSNFWIDNEWDTMRSRGLLGTSRVSGTVSEG